jgi:hypothetical protein
MTAALATHGVFLLQCAAQERATQLQVLRGHPPLNLWWLSSSVHSGTLVNVVLLRLVAAVLQTCTMSRSGRPTTQQTRLPQQQPQLQMLQQQTKLRHF